jgi:methylglutaconyl-CoA hydratase
MDFVLTSSHDRIAEIILNRPEKRNALNPQVVAELTEAFKRAEADQSVKVILLKANGPNFSAGADLAYLQQLQSHTFQENLKDSLQLKGLLWTIYNSGKPVIAQVEGHAIAGGCGLISACDIVFSVPEALFGYTEAKIGFVPALVASFLVRKIGEGRSRELLLNAELITAEHAHNYGLVNYIKEKSVIGSEVYKYAENMVETTSAESIKLTKALLSKVSSMTMEDSLIYAAKLNAEARLTEDCKKGIAAFLDKKQPKW